MHSLHSSSGGSSGSSIVTLARGTTVTERPTSTVTVTPTELNHGNTVTLGKIVLIFTIIRF